jgi:hypothetical protein
MEVLSEYFATLVFFKYAMLLWDVSPVLVRFVIYLIDKMSSSLFGVHAFQTGAQPLALEESRKKPRQKAPALSCNYSIC